MKNNQTALGPAIIKMVLVLCIAVTAGTVNAQELDNRYIRQEVAEAAAAKNAATKAEKYRNAAARLWELAEGGEEKREARLRLALQYADSAKYYRLQEHEQLKAQLNRPRKDSSMRSTYMRLAAENGEDTTKANWLINGIKTDLKKYDKPQAQTASPQQNGAAVLPEKKDAGVTNTNKNDSNPTGQQNNATKSENPTTDKPSDAVMKRDSTTETPPNGDSGVKIEMIELNLKSSGPIKIDSIKPSIGGSQGYWIGPSEKSRTDWPEPMPYNGPKEQKNTSGVTSKVIVTDVPETPEPKSHISWEMGLDAGITWSPMTAPTSEPSFIHITDPTFGTDSQVQGMWNEIFRGMVFPNTDSIRTINLPGWQLGINAGCIIDNRFEVKLAVTGGTFTAKQEIPVRVVRMAPPSSPSAPPTTQQSMETINEKVLIGNFNTRLTGRIYFGKKVRGYAEAGGVFGLNYSATVLINAGDYSEKKSNARTAIYGGGTVGIGVNIPLTNMLSFETGIAADLVSMRKQFSATLGLNAGLRILF